MKLLIALFPLALLAQPALTPSTVTIVKQGNSQIITSSVPVTWTLEPGSVGTLVTNSSTQATYTAPASVAARNLNGCSMPADHVYNTNIASLPVHASNTTYLNTLTAGTIPRLVFSIDFPENVAKNGTPTDNIIGYYTNPSGPAVTVPVFTLYTREQEGGVIAARNNDGADHHLISINSDTCTAADQYQYYQLGANGSCANCNAQSVISYPLISATSPSQGTDAAGMPLQPLLLRADEVRNGAVKHALRFSMSNTFLKQSTYVWPATASSAAPSGTIPYGTRFRLKSTFNISTFCAGKNNPTYCNTILTGLANYGAFAVDGTSCCDIDFSGAGDLGYDPDVAKSLAEISYALSISAANWEAVDESTLQDTTYNPSASSTLTALVPPSLGTNATVVKATAVTGGLITRLRLINQGGAVGFDAHKNYQYILSGTTTTFSANVSGLSASTVTWSMSPTVGSLNASTGAYTAPTVGTVTTTTITATSTVDGTVSGSFVLSVFPALPLRVNLGGTSLGSPAPGSLVSGNYVDSGSQTWWTNYLKPGYYSNGANDNSGLSFTNGTGYDIFPIWSEAYYLGDHVSRMILPAGNYLIKPIMYYSGVNATGTEYVNIDSQSQVVRTKFDQKSTSRGASITPNATAYPATVGADNQLYFAVRKLDNVGQPRVAALVITTDPAAPNLTIDNPDGAGSNITIGTAHKLYCVSGGGLATGCTFAITGGSGTLTTIDSTSTTYTAPGTPPPVASPQTVTITATSTADGTKTATTTFVRIFGTIGVTAAYSTVTRQLTDQFSANLSGTAYTNVTWSATKGTINSSGLWTAPNTSVDTTATITATSLDDGSQFATSTVTVKAAPAEMYAHFGDSQPDVTDTAGKVWISETHLPSFSVQGQSIAVTCNQQCTGVTGSSPAATILGVSDPAQQDLYRGAHYGYPYSTPIGDAIVTYTLPPGVYTVVMKFADYNAAYEPTVFQQDIVANGVTLASGYNFALAAGAARTAIDRTFTVNNTGTSLAIQFLHNTTKLPQINAMSVVYAGPLPSTASVLQGVVTNGVTLQ